MPNDDSSGHLSATSHFVPAQPPEASLMSLVNVVLRDRLLVGGVALVCALSGIVYALIQPRTYTATSSFMPQAPRTANGLTGIAAQLGLALPNAQGVQTPAFYADLVESRELLGAVVDADYEFASDTGIVRGTLTEIGHATGRTPAIRREKTIRSLKRVVRPAVVQQTGVVTVAVTEPSAALADQINQRILALVNRFNMETRQSQAGAERRFTERRLAEVKADLRAAEDRLQFFRQQNRDLRSSPELTLEQDRREREVTRQQQVYTVLSQAYEQAKIEEVRDTPVITIVQPSNPPVLPDPRGLLKLGVLGLLVGCVIGCLLAFLREFMARSRQEDPEDFEEFATLKQEALDDLLHPWRPLQRLVQRRRVL